MGAGLRLSRAVPGWPQRPAPVQRRHRQCPPGFAAREVLALPVLSGEAARRRPGDPRSVCPGHQATLAALPGRRKGHRVWALKLGVDPVSLRRGHELRVGITPVGPDVTCGGHQTRAPAAAQVAPLGAAPLHQAQGRSGLASATEAPTPTPTPEVVRHS